MADESLLLDDATAEAKRRGHRIVVPAHLAIVFAAFTLLQRIRFDPNETSVYGKAATRPRDTLQVQRDRLIEAVEEIGLELPTQEEVLDALRDYEMFSEQELATMASELPF